MNTVTWDYIYKHWCFRLKYMLTDECKALRIWKPEEIVINSKEKLDGFEIVTRRTFNELKEQLENGNMQYMWGSLHGKKGIIRTAEIFGAAKTEEETASIWMAATITAFLSDREGYNFLSYEMRDKLIHNIEYCMPNDFIDWHYAMTNIIPIEIPHFLLELFAKSFKFDDSNLERFVDNLVEIVQTNAILVSSSHVLVESYTEGCKGIATEWRN